MKGNHKLDLSVVIVSWNVRDFLRKTLVSIYKFTHDIGFEIFVVDNNSQDGSAEMVSREFPGVRLIINRENVGFSKANNQAVKESTGRYILLLNPDTELIDNSLKSMVEYLDANLLTDAVGCKLLCSDGSLQTSCRRFPSLLIDLIESLYLDSLFPRSAFFNRYRMAGWEHDDLRQVDQLYGACLLLRGELFQKIGLMDERYFMYYDEVDFCYRIKKNGGRIFFLPQVSIIHHGNKSSDQAGFQIEIWKIRSRLLFFKKRYGDALAWVLFVNLFLRSLVALTVFPAANLLSGRPRHLKQHLDYIVALWKEYLNFFKANGG